MQTTQAKQHRNFYAYSLHCLYKYTNLIQCQIRQALFQNLKKRELWTYTDFLCNHSIHALCIVLALQNTDSALSAVYQFIFELSR